MAERQWHVFRPSELGLVETNAQAGQSPRQEASARFSRLEAANTFDLSIVTFSLYCGGRSIKGREMIRKLAGLAILWVNVFFCTSTSAQVQTEVPAVVPGAKPVTVGHIKIHGESLEGNLEEDAVDRDALVFLPPSYNKDKHRRFPVVYALPGYFIGAEQWGHEIQVPQTIEGAFAQGAKEMIAVLPDSKTLHDGSMYSSSVTTGDFEQFIARDVVAYIDSHYRTIPNRLNRGLVGHSMGRPSCHSP
jgi:hypothetical protein